MLTEALKKKIVQLLSNTSRLIIFSILLKSLALPCFALDFTPRQWSHLPVGLNFAGVAYADTEADIAVNPVTMLEDVEMELETWVSKYIRTFELLDKSVRIDLTQAYIQGEWTGLLEGVPASVYRSGFSDTFVRFGVNLYGAPPLSAKEFAAYKSSKEIDTVVGAALVVRLPTGQYKDDKLINLGKNRFTFRPQLGVTHTRGKWTTEVTGEVAFHTDNDDFFNGQTLEQDPTYIIHAHLIHTFRPGLWVSSSIGYDYVGENSIDGVDSDNEKENFGWALNFAYPINRQSGFNVAYLATRRQQTIGLDSDTLSASLSFSW